MKAAICLLLVLALANSAQGVIRHQFALKLKSKSASSTVISSYNALVAKAPAAGKPVSYKLSADLGIPPTGPKLVQGDLGGYIDFKDVASIKAFFAYLRASATYKQLEKSISATYAIQINITTSYPAKGKTVYSTSVWMGFNASTLAIAGNAIGLFTQGLALSPVQPTSWTFGSDLGLAKQLYPQSKVPNYNLGFAIQFNTKADLIKFIQYATSQAVYKTFIESTTGSVQVQYAAKY